MGYGKGTVGKRKTVAERKWGKRVGNKGEGTITYFGEI